MRIAGLSWILAGLLLGCSSSPPQRPDLNTPSVATTGDATALIEGCGNQPIAGFTYCRVSEGDSTDKVLWFLGPPAKCQRKDGCVYVKVWNTQGGLAWGESFSKDATRISVPWSKLVGRPSFDKSDRGFWTWSLQVFWQDPDGREHLSKATGDLVLRVYSPGYIPLHDVESDPNFTWTWTDHQCLFKMTSGLRAFVKCNSGSL